MDLSQLRGAGSISYSPASSDVVFRMEVTGPDQAKTASESVRVLRTRPSPLEEQQQQAQQQQAQQQPAGKPAPQFPRRPRLNRSLLPRLRPKRLPPKPRY